MISLFASPFLNLLMGFATEQSPENPENWTEHQVSEWFDQKEWLGETKLQPDPSIDKKEFAVRYHQNKERWDTALTFLKEENLSKIEVGTYELDSRDVFVMVSEYDSKNHANVQYEAHKNYSDIQYVVSGQEYIGLSERSAASLKTPYDKEKDIAFYDVEEGQHLLARPGTFFIFFPEDLHSPEMKVKGRIPIRKIVIKVKN